MTRTTIGDVVASVRGWSGLRQGDVLGTSLVVSGTILILLAVTLLRGWVLTLLWGWFLVPGFGAPPLSVPLAIGLSLIVGCLSNEDTHQADHATTYLLATFANPILALLVGALVQCFL